MVRFLCGPMQVLNPLKIYTSAMFLHLFRSCRTVFRFLENTFSDTYRPIASYSVLSFTFPSFPNLPEDSPLGDFLTLSPSLKGAISRFYTQMNNLSIDSLDSIKLLWETDLEEEISCEVWREILGRVHSSSICAKACLSKIYKDVSLICDRSHPCYFLDYDF